MVTFRTGIIASSKVTGRRKLVMNPSDIARVYLRGTFVYDVLAVVPFFMQCGMSLLSGFGYDAFFDPSSSSRSALNALHALRLLRVFRLARLRKHLFGATIGSTEAMLSRETAMSPLMMYTLQTLYESAMIINFFAAVLIYTAKMQGYSESWLQAVDNLDLAAVSDSLGFDSEVYVAGLYFSTAIVTTVGFGDASAVTNLERVVTSVCMTVGATYYAFLVGSIANIIEKYGSAASRRAAYREKMVDVYAFFKRNDIPYHLKAHMASFYRDVWIRSLGQTDDADAALLRELPEDLRREVSAHISERRRRAAADEADPRAGEIN